MPRPQVPPASRRFILGASTAALGLLAAQGGRAAIVNQCVVGKDGWLFPIWDEVRRTDLARVRRVAGVINEGVEVLKGAKIDVSISLTPAKSRVYREFLPDDFKFVPDTEKRYATALEELRRPGTPVADQAALFANLRRTQPTTEFFFKGDTHWTGAGADPAAVEVARVIKERIKLPPSNKPGTKLGAPVSKVQDRNDLAELLPPADKAKYPQESYLVRQPVDAGAGGLLDDDTADTVVIGNSFMQPKYGFSSVVSNQLDRPVALVWKVHQFSPYWTLLNYARSDAFKKQRPKLIVWNFQETDLETTTDNNGAWGQNAMPSATFLSELRKAVGA